MSSPDPGHPRSIRANSCSLGFTEVMSAFSHLAPAMHEQDLAETTVDPVNMLSDSNTSPNTSRRHDSVYTTLPTPRPLHSNARDAPFDTPQHHTKESRSTSRARYAANQRHNKAQEPEREGIQASEADMKADEKKQRLREKNKVAATKCRQRQRKQADTIQAKCGRLSKTNAQLKSCVQGLRQDLDRLRAIALYHADCNCQIAWYNRARANRVIAEYYSSYSCHSGTAMTEKTAELQF